MFCHISVLWKVLLCEMCCYVKSVGCCVSYRWAKWKVPVCERCCYVKGASMWKVPVVVCHIGSYVKCAGIWKVLLCERCQYEKGVGCCVIQVSYVKGAVMWKVQDCRYVKSVAMWKVPVCERCRLLCVSYSWAMWKVYVYVKGAAMWNVLLCERCCYVKRVVMWNVLFIVCVVQVSYVKGAGMWNVLLCEMFCYVKCAGCCVCRTGELFERCRLCGMLLHHVPGPYLHVSWGRTDKRRPNPRLSVHCVVKQGLRWSWEWHLLCSG